MSRPRAGQRDFDKLLAAAAKQGWRLEHGGRNIKCWSPDGVHMVVVPQTPASRARGLENKRAEFRRAGLAL